MDTSNTDEKQKIPGRFTKGDPRINRNGRPRSFDKLRSLAQEISHEIAKHDGRDLIIDGHKVTVAEAILRRWAQSKDPRLQMKFIEVAFGNAPNKTELDLSGAPVFLTVPAKNYTPEEWQQQFANRVISAQSADDEDESKDSDAE